MFALVVSQVDVGHRALEEHRNPGAQRGGIAGQGEYRAVVRSIGLHVEDAKTRHRLERGGHLLDDIEAAAFTDVGNTFDHGHVTSSLFHLRAP